MSLKLGNTDLNALNLGGVEINKAYLGAIEVFSASAVTAEYQAVLDRGTTEGFALPSAGEQIKGNQLMIDLIANGSFALMTTLQVYSGSNSDFSRIDWVDPTNVYVAVNSPTYSNVTGFKFDGTNYLRSNSFLMTTDLTTIQNYGGGWNAASYDYSGTTRALMGIQESSAQTFIQLIREEASMDTSCPIGGNVTLSSPTELQPNLNYISTTNALATGSDLFEDGSIIASTISTRVDALINPRQWVVGSENFNGNNGGTFSSLCSIKYMFLGAYLAGKEASINTAFENYLA